MEPKLTAEFAQFALENLPDGAFLIAQDAAVVYVNKAACEQLGYTEQELLGMKIMDINPYLTRAIWDTVWGVTVSDKFQMIETEHRTKDGRMVPMEVSANFVRINGVQYSCTFTRDISERKALEARVRQNDKMEIIGRLAGGVAHDFNNQLGGILGFADILRSQMDTDPDLAHCVDSIIKAAENSASLTRQLLAFSRQGKYLFVQVNLNRVIEDMVKILRRSIGKKIEIVTMFYAQSAFVAGDTAQIENALLNLAVNARDAMPRGGTITITTDIKYLDESFCKTSAFDIQPGTYVEVTVADTGEGMNKETRLHAFEPFFTTKEQSRGTGLGLASVYSSIKSHQGAVFIASEVGRGVAVTMYLPRLDETDRTYHSRTRPTALPKRLSAEVMVVEDEPLMLDVTGIMLGQLGCRSVPFLGGREAVDYYRNAYEKTDLVILDLLMPDLDGEETYLQLKQINPDVRVLVISGFSGEEAVQSILDKGAAGYLQKPFRADDLAEVLSRILPDSVLNRP